MTKTTQLQVRLTEDEKHALQAKASAEGWRSVSDLIRSLVQSAEHPQQTAQHQPDHRDE